MLGLRTSVRERSTILSALKLLGPVLPPELRLTPGWVEDDGAIPVFSISDLDLAPSDLSWVPTPNRAILVHSDFSALVTSRFAHPDTAGVMEVKCEVLLAVVLLHELGHLSGATEVSEELESLFPDLTAAQSAELAADEYAAALLRLANSPARIDAMFSVQAMLMNLTHAQWNLAAWRITHLGDIFPRASGFYADPGLSHPNFELRYLTILQSAQPTPATKAVLREFLKNRVSGNTHQVIDATTGQPTLLP